MELHDNGFLEELLALRRETWESYTPTEMSGGLCSNAGALEYYQENPGVVLPCPSSFVIPEQGQPLLTSAFNDVCCPFNEEGISMNEMEAAYNKSGTNLSFPCQEDCISAIDDEELGLLCENIYNSENPKIGDMEMTPSSMDVPAFDVGACAEKKNRVKRLEGQPSKNLMAERRRRKRLNDRLSMLRSVVPKISKVNQPFAGLAFSLSF